jgi:uncharacterized protein with NRDE domain
MCTILFAYKSHPEYPLIFLGNRDEFKNRPSMNAHFWEENPNVFGGRDLVACGTWTGITKTGRLAFITNHRQLPLKRDVPKSRGALTSEFLVGVETPQKFLKRIQNEHTEYAPFNLVVGTLDELWFYSNIEDEIKRIEPGIHGLSNGLLDTPWYKVEKGKRRLAEQMDSEIIVEDLFQILNDEEIPHDDLLPKTGVTMELERTLSPIHIDTAEYGTVFKTIIMVDHNGLVRFYETKNTKSISLSSQFQIMAE